MSSQRLFFSWLNKPNTLNRRGVLQPSVHLCGPPLDSLKQLHILLVLVAQGLHGVLQMEPHGDRVKGKPLLAVTFLLMQTKMQVALAFWTYTASSFWSFQQPTPPSPSPHGCFQSILCIYLCLATPWKKNKERNSIKPVFHCYLRNLRWIISYSQKASCYL